MENTHVPKGRYPLLEHPVTTALSIFVLYGVLRTLALASEILLIGFFSVLLATLLTYPLDFFSRYVPRVVGLLATIALVFGALAGLIVLAVPLLMEQARRLASEVPIAESRVEAFWQRLHGARGTSRLLDSAGIGERIAHGGELLLGKAVPFAADVLSLGGLVVAVFALALFLAYSPGSYRDGFIGLLPITARRRALEVSKELGDALRNWTLGIFGAMVTMGLFAGIGLAIAGIDAYFLLAILTGLGTFVPYVGALASAIPGLLVGLAQSPTHFLYAGVVYAGVHLVEGYLVEPLIMRRAMRIPPATLLFWQLLMAAVFGLPGLIVATPLLACLDVCVRTFWIRRGEPGESAREGATPRDV